MRTSGVKVTRQSRHFALKLSNAWKLPAAKWNQPKRQQIIRPIGGKSPLHCLDWEVDFFLHHRYLCVLGGACEAIARR